MRRAGVVLLLAGVLACGGASEGPNSGGGGGGYDYSSEGAALYAELCQVCHGEIGEGGLGPALQGTEHGAGALAAIIDERMPQSDPARCTGACAESIAAFIREGLGAEALACDAVRPSARRLRLLTRREYRNTVRDLFGAAAPACASPADCEFRQRCDGARCADSACDGHTFVYDPQGRALSSVHVAGTFNDWAGSVADGAWSLDYDASAGVWVGAFVVAEGTHQYKLVLDGTEWVVDPRSPQTAPDGFGGVNAVLALSCAGGSGGGADPAVSLPIEPRLEGFPFDTDADAAVVTAAHVDAYLDAAEVIADDAAGRIGDIAPCDWEGDAEGCARSMVAAIGRRAFRRPLSDDERARYMSLALDDGVATALHAMLVSPAFLYRSETGEPAADGRYRLTGYELAAALSYMFVGTGPDDALLDAAAAGELDDVEGIERHARRLLADPRARATAAVFAMQWLGAERIESADKHPQLFPQFSPAVRSAMAEETRRLFTHVVFDAGGSFAQLLRADYTFVDAALAPIYDMQAPGGGGFRMQPYPHRRRPGLLGHGSVLASYAHSDQTSPIRRGLLVRRRLLCQELPPPPPEAGGVPDVDADATTRERFAQHTADPVCAGCHRYIDSVGFGFERFDAIGRWRETEAGQAIDSSGDMNDVERLGDGTSAAYHDLPGLAAIIADSDAARSCFARQYYRFARGLRETLQNRCARLWIEERFRASGYDVRELMIAVATSPDFRIRR